jgi:hypothetical protein
MNVARPISLVSDDVAMRVRNSQIAANASAIEIASGVK